MTRLLLLCAAALAVIGCQKNAAPAPANDNAANITAFDERSLPSDANITEIPEDDGDAPADTETNAR